MGDSVGGGRKAQASADSKDKRIQNASARRKRQDRTDQTRTVECARTIYSKSATLLRLMLAMSAREAGQRSTERVRMSIILQLRRTLLLSIRIRVGRRGRVGR